jgi:RNA polymerase sigma-70 factor (ECF subfamily)
MNPVTRDLDWLKRCAAGEPAACRQLVERHSRVVGSVILRALGRPDGVEDLVQETFLKVFRALPEYEGRAKLSTWMCTIAHRVAMDELRRRQRQPALVPGEDFDEPADPQDLTADLEGEERDALVHRALAALPDKYRLPLVYSAIDELDHETIAFMLSLPAGTPKTHIHRAKAQMREQLAKHFAREPRHD